MIRDSWQGLKIVQLSSRVIYDLRIQNHYSPISLSELKIMSRFCSVNGQRPVEIRGNSSAGVSLDEKWSFPFKISPENIQ